MTERKSPSSGVFAHGEKTTLVMPSDSSRRAIAASGSASQIMSVAGWRATSCH